MAPGSRQVRDKVGYPEAGQRSPTERQRHSRSRVRPRTPPTRHPITWIQTGSHLPPNSPKGFVFQLRPSANFGLNNADSMGTCDELKEGSFD